MIQNTCLKKNALKRKYPQELYCGPVQALGSAQAWKNKVGNTVIPAHLLIKILSCLVESEETSAIFSKSQQIQN